MELQDKSGALGFGCLAIFQVSGVACPRSNTYAVEMVKKRDRVLSGCIDEVFEFDAFEVTLLFYEISDSFFGLFYGFAMKEMDIFYANEATLLGQDVNCLVDIGLGRP